MSIFTRPHVLVWHAESWQVVPWSESLLQSFSQPKTTLAQALLVLDSLSINKKWHAVMLPEAWVSHGQQQLEPDFPTSLCAVAAHTYAGQILPLADSERVTCFAYQEHRRELQFAVLAKSDWRRLRQHQRCPIYSERLIHFLGTSSWSALKHQLKPFAEYSDDYLERQAIQRRSHRVSTLMLAALVAILSYGSWQYFQAPASVVMLPTVWPEMGRSVTASDSLKYIRALPAQLRLDAVRITSDEVFVSLSGRAKDVELWQTNWPSHLPSLRIDEEGLQ